MGSSKVLKSPYSDNNWFHFSTLEDGDTHVAITSDKYYYLGEVFSCMRLNRDQAKELANWIIENVK